MSRFTIIFYRLYLWSRGIQKSTYTSHRHLAYSLSEQHADQDDTVQDSPGLFYQSHALCKLDLTLRHMPCRQQKPSSSPILRQYQKGGKFSGRSN